MLFGAFEDLAFHNEMQTLLLEIVGQNKIEQLVQAAHIDKNLLENLRFYFHHLKIRMNQTTHLAHPADSHLKHSWFEHYQIVSQQEKPSLLELATFCQPCLHP